MSMFRGVTLRREMGPFGEQHGPQPGSKNMRTTPAADVGVGMVIQASILRAPLLFSSCSYSSASAKDWLMHPP